jgi:beta-glucanase (GH16 family)
MSWTRFLVSSLLSGVALLPLAALGIVACGDSGGGEAPAEWIPVWEDEFEGPAGQLPDPGKWGFDIGTDWGNGQLEYDTDRAENASLDGNGNLAITAREESYQGRNYTSARMTTENKFEPTYGRFEARIKLPVGNGIWPAFWLLGADFDSVGWPQTGEIDVMEYLGQRPQEVHGTIHGPGYSASNAISRMYILEGSRFDLDFHRFAVEWDQSQIRWFVDDSLFHAVDRADVPGEWVFDHPFYLILNVAVGGAWPGPPDASTRFPQTMLVDWVRVYRKAQ